MEAQFLIVAQPPQRKKQWNNQKMFLFHVHEYLLFTALMIVIVANNLIFEIVFANSSADDGLKPSLIKNFSNSSSLTGFVAEGSEITGTDTPVFIIASAASLCFC